MMLVRLGSVGLYVITKAMVLVRLVIVFLSASDREMSEARCIWVLRTFLSYPRLAR